MSSKDTYLRGKRVTLTGATGFVGSHLLAKILEQKPASVQLISRGSATKRITKFLSQVKIIKYHSQKKYIESIIQSKPDYLFLLGGNSDPRLSVSNPKYDLNYNLLYNFYLLEAIKKNKKFRPKIIFISSVAVYGESVLNPLSERTAPTIPLSPYGINKLAMEGYVRFFSQTANIQGFSIRLFSTYGPKLYKQVVFDFITKLLHNPKNLEVLGDGSEIRDISYIDDQVEGILTLAKKAAFKGEVYNLGSGVGISIRDLAQKIAILIKIKPTFTFLKNSKEKHHGQTWIADIAHIRRLGHVAKVSIDEGLQKTIAWKKSH